MKKINYLLTRPGKILLIFTLKSRLSVCCALLPKELKIFLLMQILPRSSRQSESIIQKTRTLLSSWHLFSFCGKVILPLWKCVIFFKGRLQLFLTLQQPSDELYCLSETVVSHFNIFLWGCDGHQENEGFSYPSRNLYCHLLVGRTSFPAELEGRPLLDVHEQDGTRKSQHSLIVFIP